MLHFDGHRILVVLRKIHITSVVNHFFYKSIDHAYENVLPKIAKAKELLFLRPPIVPWVLMSSVALSPKRLKSTEPAWSSGPAGYSISRRMNGFVLSAGLWTAFPQSQNLVNHLLELFSISPPSISYQIYGRISR